MTPAHLAVALDGAGWHPAAWREPDARSTELFTARYWTDVVREAERGFLDFVTFEDSFAPQSTGDGRTDRVRGRFDATLIASTSRPPPAPRIVLWSLWASPGVRLDLERGSTVDGVPAAVAPMLAVEGPLPVGGGWAYETKWDGFRCCMRVGPDGTTKLTSRLGNEITNVYPDLLGVMTDALAGRRAVLDGELVVLASDGRPDFHLMQFRHQRGPTAELLRTAPVTYIVFDLLQLGDDVLLAAPYARRRAVLADLPVTSARVAVPRHFTAEDIDPNELLAVVEEQQLEGLVAKRLESRYHPGQRSRDWIKRPLIKTQEVLVGGWRPGKGNRSGRVGGLLLGAHDSQGRLRYIGDVGTGFSERALDELLDLLTPLARSTSPFDDEVPADRRRDARWVEPSLVGQVVYRQFTSDHRLRHTAWRGLRHDVLAEQVSWPASE